MKALKREYDLYEVVENGCRYAVAAGLLTIAIIFLIQCANIDKERAVKVTECTGSAWTSDGLDCD